MRTRARPRRRRDLVKHISLDGLEVSRLGLGYLACRPTTRERASTTLSRSARSTAPWTSGAVAWLLAQGDDIPPIPGTKRVSRLEENAAADTIGLTAGQLARLTAIPPPWANAAQT